ncbi:glyoxylate/hydroxypyruvate reductase A [soil metagenome]
MTTVAILSTYLPLECLKPALLAADAALDVAIWPDPRCHDAEVAVCLHPPAGIYARMPNLRLIHCVGAGVDSILVDQEVGGVPVCRVVDPTLCDGMFEYVLWGLLHFSRGFDNALLNQRSRQWKRQFRRPRSECRVGVMGLGELGGPVSTGLASLGFAVSGWSRSKRSMDGVETFAGNTELPAFLSRLDVLVCLLPLTTETAGILNKATFAALPKGAALILAGRGEQLVEEDLIDALQSGHLRGAVLDVFKTEPLPGDNPLWTTPGVVVTPHMASSASDEEIAGQIVDNLTRLNSRAPLVHQVDISRGY